MFTQCAEGDGNPLAGAPYRPTKLLGSGFAAEVFEAADPQGRLHAVKVLRAIHKGSQRAAWRLLQESRVLAQLDHPNLVPLRDVGLTWDGRPYFVMPRLRGETLRSRIDRAGALPPGEAARLIAGLLDGLAVAHRAGIVHRDIKPSNIFLVSLPKDRSRGAGAGETRAVLIDFGIAKLRRCVRRTTPFQILGTPRYFAPEQILGGHVDGRTDIYATGLVLFEAIAGRGPYDTQQPIGLMREHLATPPADLSTLAGVAAELASVVARALEKPVWRRWQTAGAFARALRAACPDAPASPMARHGVERRPR